MPKSWRVKRKGNTFIVRPKPSGHKMENSVPLLVAIRDMLKFAKTLKEVKYIIADKGVMVCLKKAYDPKRPIGLFDVLSFPSIDRHYRLVISKSKKLSFIEIPKSESKLLITKITNKAYLKSSKVQLNLFGGYNLVVDKDSFKANDSLVIDLEKKKIVKSFAFEKGNMVYLFAGKHKGKLGIIKTADVEKKGNEKAAKFVFSSGNTDYETLKEYAIVVGKNKPELKLEE